MGTNAPRPAAKDRAYEWVKERILEGDYPGGELLSEGEVADALDCSRTPVREAFLLLEAEGLMRLYPKRGGLVVPVTSEEIGDVMETRWVVEPHAAAMVAGRGDRAGTVATLAELIDEQERVLAAGDRSAFVEADRLFHHRIVEAAGNAILTRLSHSLRDRQRRMVATTVARAPDLTARFVAEHRAILAAIERGDPGEASTLMRAHLEGSRRGIEGAVGS